VEDEEDDELEVVDGVGLGVGVGVGDWANTAAKKRARAARRASFLLIEKAAQNDIQNGRQGGVFGD